MSQPFQRKRLILNLYDKQSHSENLENDAIEYIGGKGLNLHFLKKNGMDKDVISIANGPFAGSGFPCSSFSYVSKFSNTLQYPVTSGFGGGFGLAMGMAGLAQIVLKGSAKSPVSIVIDNEEVHFIDASSLEGKSALSTDMYIQEKYNDMQIETLCVGHPPKDLLEHAILFSSGTWPVYRFGFGGDFVEKRIKVIGIRGDGGTLIHSPKTYLSFISHLFTKIAQDKQLSMVNSGWNLIKMLGDLPSKFFDGDREACYSCPVGCARLIPIEGPPYLGRALCEEILFLSMNMKGKECDQLLMEAYKMREDSLDPLILFTDYRDMVEKLHNIELEKKLPAPLKFKGIPFYFDPAIMANSAFYYNLTCQDYDYFKLASYSDGEVQSLQNMMIMKTLSDMIGICPLITSRVPIITMEDLHEGFENLYGRKETLDKKAKKLIDMERKMSGFSKDDDLLDASWDEKLSKFYKAMDWDDQGTPEE